MTTRARTLIAFAALATGALPAAAAAGGAPHGGIVARAPTVVQGTPGTAPSAARLAACRRSLRPEGRVAVVAVTMRTIPEATRFAVKLDLYERTLGASGWTLRSDVPGLGSWTAPSDPALGTRAADVYKVRQAVARLLVGSAYRFHVGFRWLDADGKIVREAASTTRACRQPDLRPDLTVASVDARASKRSPGLVRYIVVVRNDGRSPARSVTLAATLPGDASPGTRIVRIGRLEPGASAGTAFTGPGCAIGDPAGPSFQVDPANEVDEADEADDVLTLACPIP